MMQHLGHVAAAGCVYSLPLEAFDNAGGQAAQMSRMRDKMSAVVDKMFIDPRTLIRRSDSWTCNQVLTFPYQMIKVVFTKFLFKNEMY